jgi:DNA-directed RNA polymerase subunit RPC12/RpoP
MNKLDFVSDESNYFYKCLHCGGQLEEDQRADSWNVLSLDNLERWYCPKCGNNYEYYYSLDCIQAYDGDYDQVGTIVFTNKVGADKVEIINTEGIFEEMEKERNL